MWVGDFGLYWLVDVPVLGFPDLEAENVDVCAGTRAGFADDVHVQITFFPAAKTRLIS